MLSRLGACRKPLTAYAPYNLWVPILLSLVSRYRPLLLLSVQQIREAAPRELDRSKEDLRPVLLYSPQTTHRASAHSHQRSARVLFMRDSQFVHHFVGVGLRL